MSKKQSSEAKREVLSYEEKFKIINEYLVKNNAFQTGITARTKYGKYPIGQWQANMRKKYYRGELKLSVG